MLVKTRGIVLHHIKYSETSVIAKVFTEEFGLQSYMVKGARGKSRKGKANVFQALSQIELSANQKEKNSLHTVREVGFTQAYKHIPFDVRKSSIGLFLAEVLYKIVREETQNKPLFDFLSNSLYVLDLTENPAHFHLLMLVKLTRYLGFQPQGAHTSKTPYFNLEEGCFSASAPAVRQSLAGEASQHFSLLLGTNFDDLDKLKIPYIARKALLENLLLYYRLHTEGLQELNAHHILETVFSE